MQLIIEFDAFLTVQVIDPPGVNPDEPVRITDKVVVPPKTVAVFVMEPIVGVRVEIPAVT